LKHLAAFGLLATSALIGVFFNPWKDENEIPGQKDFTEVNEINGLQFTATKSEEWVKEDL